MKHLIQNLIIFSLFIFTLCEELVRLNNIKVVGDNVEGEVEFFYNEEWRPLAARIWSLSAANVTCKTVGFEAGAVEAKKNDLYGRSKRRNYYYLFIGLQCSGDESDVTKCYNWNKDVIDMKVCSEGIAISVCKR